MELNKRNKFRGIKTGQVDVRLSLFTNYMIIYPESAGEPKEKETKLLTILQGSRVKKLMDTNKWISLYKKQPVRRNKSNKTTKYLGVDYNKRKDKPRV